MSTQIAEKIKTDIEAANKVAVARYQMVKTTPFFGIIASNLKIVPVSEKMRGRVTTAAVTPTGICMYNPDFVNSLSFEEVKGLLAHEAMHPALGFWQRFRLRDIELANKAHDYAINVPIVESPDMQLPKGGLYNEKYCKMSAEEIYFIIEEEEKNSKQAKGEGKGTDTPSGEKPRGNSTDGEGEKTQGDDYTLQGDIDESIIEDIEKEYYNESRGKDVSEDELSDIRVDAEQRWRDTLQQAYVAERAEGKGNLPAWMVAEIEGILFPKMNFRKLLKRFFGNFGHPARPSFKHRNKRNTFLPNTFVKPQLIKNLPKLYMLIDTSGSMWDEEGYKMVQGGLGLIKRLANNDQYEIVVIMADTCVKKEMEFKDVLKAIKDRKLQSLGGGGSSFVSAFERIWERSVTENMGQAPILCITDGAIDVPVEQAKIQTATAWITPKNVRPPTTKWGAHMEMEF